MTELGYNELRHLADSWGLVLLTIVFLAAVAWALWPGRRDRFRDHADIPFKYDEKD